MDQVLWRTHLLVATLIGYSLFLGFVIDRMHHCLRKLVDLRASVGTSKHEVEKVRKERSHLKEQEVKAAKEMKMLREEISSLKKNLNKLKLDANDKEKKAVSAEAHVAALQKQAENLLLEYDRLLEDNQNLQSQFAFRG